MDILIAGDTPTKIFFHDEETRLFEESLPQIIKDYLNEYNNNFDICKLSFDYEKFIHDLFKQHKTGNGVVQAIELYLLYYSLTGLDVNNDEYEYKIQQDDLAKHIVVTVLSEVDKIEVSNMMTFLTTLIMSSLKNNYVTVDYTEKMLIQAAILNHRFVFKSLVEIPLNDGTHFGNTVSDLTYERALHETSETKIKKIIQKYYNL